MKTYFIGAEEVRAYLRDLLDRIRPFPELWCPITESGIRLVSEFVGLMEESDARRILVEPIEVRGEEVTIPEESLIRGKNVLLLDSAIHSGRMMTHCVQEILKCNPATLTTYALAVKRCSSFIPTLWGVMTDETDRPYFLLDKIPNNRLNAGAKRAQAAVHLRLLDQSYSEKQKISSGLPSIDRVTWSDRHYQMQTNPGTSTYVLEQGSATVGFVTIHLAVDHLTIGEVVIADSHRDKGYGGVLIRFAETMARQANCRTVRLHAISDRVDTYKRFGYRQTTRIVLKLDDEQYHPMEREVLYHQGRHVDGSNLPLPSDPPMMADSGGI